MITTQLLLIINQHVDQILKSIIVLKFSLSNLELKITRQFIIKSLLHPYKMFLYLSF